MSKISLSPSPTGSAVYTIASPAGSTDRTLNLPDSAGTVATAESTLAQFNVTGSAPVFACRAFVNFNGDGTVAIRASGNVSSITDNGVGQYTVNFTTAMQDANYAAFVSGTGRPAASNTNHSIGYHSTDATAASTYTTTALRVSNQTGNGTFVDIRPISVSIFR